MSAGLAWRNTLLLVTKQTKKTGSSHYDEAKNVCDPTFPRFLHQIFPATALMCWNIKRIISLFHSLYWNTTIFCILLEFRHQGYPFGATCATTMQCSVSCILLPHKRRRMAVRHSLLFFLSCHSVGVRLSDETTKRKLTHCQNMFTLSMQYLVPQK